MRKTLCFSLVCLLFYAHGALAYTNPYIFGASALPSGGVAPYGSISGGYESIPESVNLTSIGTTDWKHYALGSASDVNEKDGASVLPNYTQIGFFTEGRGSNLVKNFSWTDGTPTASASNVQTAVTTSVASTGFQWVIPASGYERTLKLYIRGYLADFTVSASMPGATSYVNEYTGGGTAMWVYTITYSGNGDLTLQFYAGSGLTTYIGVLALTISQEVAPSHIISGADYDVPTSTNLSTEGTTDWKMYGRELVSDVDEKDGASVLPNYTLIGSPTLVRNVSTPKYSWTGGTPTATGTDITSRIVAPGDGVGFQWQIPSVEATRIVSVYTRVYKATGKLTASMSGATTYTGYHVNLAGGSGRLFRVSFSGTGTLTLRWETDGIETGGDCSLSAITLSTAGDDPGAGEDPPPDPPSGDLIYVRKTGNDTTGDGTDGTPYLTIAKGLSMASSGETVVVGDGVYSTTQLTIPVGVSLVSESQDRTKVTVQPSANMGAGNPLLKLISASNVDGDQTISYITFKAINGSYRAQDAFLIQNRNNVEIHHCQFGVLGTQTGFYGSNEETNYPFKVESTSISRTSSWWTYWPSDPQASGTDTNIDTLWSGLTFVTGFKFYNNYVYSSFPLSPYIVEDMEIFNNFFDNRGTGCWSIKATAAFVKDSQIYGNTFFGDLADEPGQTPWHVELWLNRNVDIYNNLSDGFYSVTAGKDTDIYNNTIIREPEVSGYATGIEFNLQTYGSCYGNFISGAGNGIRVGIFASGVKDWLTEHIDIYRNVIIKNSYGQIRVEATGGGTAGKTNTVRYVNIYNNVADGGGTQGNPGIQLLQANNTGLAVMSDVNIKNNVSMRIPGYGMSKTGTVTNITADRNQAYLCTSGVAYGISPTNTLTTDPLFIQPGINYAGYALQSSSPCRNSGTASIASGVTITEYSGAAPDRGAIEFEE